MEMCSDWQPWNGERASKRRSQAQKRKKILSSVLDDLLGVKPLTATRKQITRGDGFMVHTEM